MAKGKKRSGKTGSGEKKERPKQAGVKRFIITYLGLTVLFVFFYFYKPIVETINVSKVYNHFLVVSASKMLNAVGFQCAYSGFVLMLPGLSLDVKFGCNGLEAVMIYSIAVLSYPARWKTKLLGITAGLLVIQAANFLRMIMLVYIGLHMRRLFDYIHIYIAQGIMIALALGVFFMYLNYANAAQEARN